MKYQGTATLHAPGMVRPINCPPPPTEQVPCPGSRRSMCVRAWAVRVFFAAVLAGLAYGCITLKMPEGFPFQNMPTTPQAPAGPPYPSEPRSNALRNDEDRSDRPELPPWYADGQTLSGILGAVGVIIASVFAHKWRVEKTVNRRNRL